MKYKNNDIFDLLPNASNWISLMFARKPFFVYASFIIVSDWVVGILGAKVIIKTQVSTANNAQTKQPEK